MTLEERLAELGIDLSDLKPVAERRYDREGHPVTVQAALMDYYADIIDRMETRIVNLTGERDYLRAKYSANPNETVPEDWSADDDGAGDRQGD